MTHDSIHSILGIALYAAFADGAKDDREREAIRRIAESLGQHGAGADFPRLYQDVLLRRVGLADLTTRLTDAGERQLAYEFAVCVCDADGRQNDAERAFLANLRPLLGLGAAQAEAIENDADAIATPDPTAFAPAVPGAAAAGTGAPSAGAPTTGAVVAVQPSVPEGELDQTILRHAILNGALELLPQSWASIAIVPLQVKLVYRIGQAYGVQLDQGHIKEFIATVGVGLTSQYLEQFGRKLIGGLFRKAAGGLAGSLGQAATGMAFSFATTYALGQVARRYYAGGRQMSTALLRQTFQELLGPAKDLQARYVPQMREAAQGLDAAKVISMVRGTP